MTVRAEDRVAGLAIANVLALALFAVGVLSPLTPSEGRPEVGAIAVFAGLPVATLLISAAFTKSTTAQVLVLLEAAVFVALAAAVLGIQVGP